MILSGSGCTGSDALFEGSPSSKSLRHRSSSVAGSYSVGHLPPSERIHQFLAFIMMRSQSILVCTSSIYFSSPAKDSGSYSCRSEWKSGSFLFHLLWCCAVCWPLPSVSSFGSTASKKLHTYCRLENDVPQIQWETLDTISSMRIAELCSLSFKSLIMKGHS